MIKSHLIEKIKRLPIISFVIRKLSNTTFTKQSISLYDFFYGLFIKVKDDEISEKAAGVAFNFTLSIFPAIIFLFTLIPLFPIDQNAIMSFLENYMPPYTFNAAESTIRDIFDTERGGLLSLGFLTAFYLASNGMTSLINAFNSCYKTKESRGFFKTKLIAGSLTIILALVFLTAIIFLILGEFVIHFISDFGLINDHLIIYSIFFMRFFVVFLIFYIAIALTYYLGPAISEKWRFFSRGALFSSILSVLSSYLFAFYINNFGTYNKIYGSIGALIAIMVWIYLLCIIILVGFEINATVDQIAHGKLDKRIDKQLKFSHAKNKSGINS